MSHNGSKKALLLTMNALCGSSTVSSEGRKMNALLEPFSYEYMLNAMWVSAMVGGLCAFLSCYLMLKAGRWLAMRCRTLLSRVLRGIYAGLPFSLGAFFSGGLAAGSMLFLNQLTRLKEDAIIGLIFSSFWLGLFMVSLNPTSVNIQTIVWAIFWQSIRRISCNSLSLAFSRSSCFFFKWKDLMVTFSTRITPVLLDCIRAD